MRDSYSIGVDLGGTNLRIASYASGDTLLDTILLPTRLADGRQQVIRDLCEAVEALSGKDYGGRNFIGVGIGIPGPLELPEGIVRNPPNLKGWDGFNFRRAVESRLGYGVEIENDANVAALAEQKLGAGKKYDVDSLCVLTLGTGLGSGFILDGQVWHGFTGMGGEAGHIFVHGESDATCGCGGHGCLEQYASATAVVRMAQELMSKEAPATAQELAQLAQAGNPDAIAVFNTLGRSIAIGLTALINTLNLPLYLLGGGVSEAWEIFSPVMFEELRRRSYVYRLTQPELLSPANLVLEHHKTYILTAQLGVNAGLLGACLLPFQLESRNGKITEGVLVDQ